MAKLRHKLIGLKRQCGEVSLNYLLLILSCPKNGDETEAERLFYRFLDGQKKFVQKAKKLEIFASPFPRPLVSPSMQFFDLCGSLSLPLYCEHFQFQLIPF